MVRVKWIRKTEDDGRICFEEIFPRAVRLKFFSYGNVTDAEAKIFLASILEVREEFFMIFDLLDGDKQILYRQK